MTYGNKMKQRKERRIVNPRETAYGNQMKQRKELIIVNPREMTYGNQNEVEETMQNRLNS